MSYSLYILKTVKRQFYFVLDILDIMDILAECTERRAVGRLSDLIHLLETVCVFYFIPALYFRTLFFYTTDFNPRIK